MTQWIANTFRAYIGRTQAALSESRTQSKMEFQITDRATTRLLALAEKEGIDLTSTYLRVAVVPGGCSGLTYDLGWDTVRQENDHLAEAGRIRLLLDRKSFLYVEGTELDFSEGLEGKGFHFLNPQAARTCACGESFGL